MSTLLGTVVSKIPDICSANSGMTGEGGVYEKEGEILHVGEPEDR
ncbi:hypothetical protein [Vibrio breoganii]|nr:hypothetical protein [Vibrio breoganii]